MMSVVYLGLGSNVGNKEDHLKRAIDALSQLGKIQNVSPLYFTEPVGDVVQNWFLNCVVEMETEREPQILLSSVKEIERILGRKKTMEKGPRVIDIDILFYDDRIIRTKTIIIPHPSIHERLFVLQPLLDLNAQFVHPLLKKTIRELYESHPWSQKVVRVT